MERAAIEIRVEDGNGRRSLLPIVTMEVDTVAAHKSRIGGREDIQHHEVINRFVLEAAGFGSGMRMLIRDDLDADLADLGSLLD